MKLKHEESGMVLTIEDAVPTDEQVGQTYGRDMYTAERFRQEFDDNPKVRWVQITSLDNEPPESDDIESWYCSPLHNDFLSVRETIPMFEHPDGSWTFFMGEWGEKLVPLPEDRR